MDSNPYSNRELDTHFSDIKETLARIEEQTIKTNGRVSKLENWRSYTAGAVAIICLVVVPITGFLALKVLELSK